MPFVQRKRLVGEFPHSLCQRPHQSESLGLVHGIPVIPNRFIRQVVPLNRPPTSCIVSALFRSTLESIIHGENSTRTLPRKLFLQEAFIPWIDMVRSHSHRHQKVCSMLQLNQSWLTIKNNDLTKHHRSLATGNGCPAVHVQWFPGRITASADRGQRVLYNLDGRGRACP
jgi:hypothetical protein